MKKTSKFGVANLRQTENELVIANAEKEIRATGLVIAKAELASQNAVKAIRAAELNIANVEKEIHAAELVIAEAELASQNGVKAIYAAELVIVNGEKAIRAAELVIANIKKFN